MQRRQLLASLAAVSFVPGMSFAQEGKPLRMIVPFPPGGATDITARTLQDAMARILKQPVVLENRGGAGGSIGMAEVARAPADGLTIGVATLSTHGVNPAVYSKLPYHPTKDFVGVTEIVKAPGVIVVNPKALPVKDFADLVKYLKANPGKVSYATPGNGTIGHMWGELFKSSTGTSMVHIPYRGAGPAINDVLAGQVAVYFDQVASSLPHIKSGKVKALAVSWPQRLDVLPDVPTYGELGHAANNDPSWFGLVAPAGTPAAAVDRIQQAVAQALQEPAVRERLAGQGLYPSGTTPKAFTAQIAREIDKMKGVAAFAKVSLD
ncbi:MULTISPECIES: tripartite tricarboxylate transporter substrate binding protein BugE [unclassified Acidovorax]|uniref:tripartite tricarboxylate transporter substrate binding protein BugE n=1 Tax=unclassified Acidovorax TaxID=2684926 RepID=UPI000BC365F7|nr:MULTISPECIES: tripartite tricarboxylate transporter substrate binding protein BugE [unclassified Acidovorax]OZA56691.1 MAG: ABC transporter substrate-binding protein [Acidovorax sp. 17-64-282]HQS22559.1 tripartite tricarboxylate transporter substrate binding protein BugE [Acidovorax defluvii]OYY30061.1 MAG: ABC transporter substrate-binding protein [Acidovorax sp. 35-64-16]OYY84107.1 MAG: ABC transporter substrate-binding protein [Acidovorax sp. 28-64-14]OYZ45282.1 MAG: ABC transporter subs